MVDDIVMTEKELRMETGNDGIARWRRIADRLENEILGGTLVGRLATESDLATRFSVNRHTVRKALAMLAEKGLVRAERGRGTFVEDRREPRLAYAVGPRTRFSENIGAASKDPGGRLIASASERASAELAERLMCRTGEPLLRLELLRVADAVPVLVSTVWLVERRFAGIVAGYAETGTLTGALESCGVSSYHRDRTEVTAEAAAPMDAERLQYAVDAPVLVTHSVDVDADGAPIITARTRFRADRISLVFDHPT